MGETLSFIISSSKINPLFSFLLPYFSTEKLSMLQTINEDNIFDEEMFNSYFQCGEREFKLISNTNGLISYWELMTIIYILKTDIYKAKVGNIISLFIFDDGDILINTDTFHFMVEVFTNSLYKIYSIDTIKEDTKAKLDEEIKNYRMSIFKANDMNEVKISNMKKFIDEDESLFNLLFSIAQSVEDTFATTK